jgi:two-component system, sensor histidine kinase and response regulator
MTRILVIEDENAILENVMEILEMEGFKVSGARNGREGVQTAFQVQPDLIICDIMMPEMDGYQVFLELQSDPATSMTPFIFLTARADYKDFRYGMELGADDYLTKPFVPNQLLKAIRTRLERQEQTQREYGKRIDEVRHQLLFSLPHELRTPLTGIIGYVGMLIEDYKVVDPDTLLDMLKAIERSSNRLHRLIENHLLFAQVEMLARQGEPLVSRPVSVDPLPIIEATLQDKAANAERATDLHQNLQGAAVNMPTDAVRKMTEEVVDNAFKFSKPGTAVQVQSRLDDGFFILEVMDHGRGMKPEQISNIGVYMQFERRIYEQQGSGLGLIIAKRLAELTGGSLTIESSPEEYTRVEMRVPLAS